MKYKHYLLIYFLITTISFSQSSHSTKTNIDSSVVKIPIVALINSNRLDRMITSGLYWGGVAIVIGATLETAFNTDADFKYMLTALGGIISSAGGIVYGMFSSIPTGYNNGKNNFGFQINVGQTMGEDSYRYIENFGLVFRYPNSSYYIPDNYVLYVGGEELNEEVTETKHSKLRLTKYGAQFRKVGYNRTINFLYGVDLGISYGSYSYFLEEDLSYYFSESKDVSSFYFDLIVGVNFNLTKFIQGSIEYQYGVFGAHTRDRLVPIFNNPAHGVTSFSVYSFIF